MATVRPELLSQTKWINIYDRQENKCLDGLYIEKGCFFTTY